MVEMGAAQRVQESRLSLQAATRERFVATIERLTHRRVRSFSSATHAEQAVVVEVFVFQHQDDTP